MLVLSRKVGQRIILGDDIEVVVLEVHGNQVRLGIQAPKEVPVHREEIARRIASEVAPARLAAQPWCAAVPTPIT